MSEFSYESFISACAEAASYGYAVVVFTPDELGDTDPHLLEQRLIEIGNQMLAD